MTRVAFALLAALALPAASPAGFTLYLYQSGNDVLLKGDGTLNTAGLTAVGPNAFGGFVAPPFGDVSGGSTVGGIVSGFNGVAGPTSFGSGSLRFADAGTGDVVRLDGFDHRLFVPYGYTPGGPLHDTSTFAGTTLAGLGATTGVYTWTWGSGATADSLTLNVGTAPPAVTATPAPATLGLVLAAAPVLAVVRARRQARVAKMVV